MAKSKLTDKLCDEICNDIKAGVPIIHSAIAHGICQSTFYDWYNKGKEAKRKNKFRDFYERVEEAKSVAITLRARRVYKAGTKDWKADAWWLERTAPEYFGRKDFHRFEGKQEIKTESELTIEDRREKDEDYIRQFIERTSHSNDGNNQDNSD